MGRRTAKPAWLTTAAAVILGVASAVLLGIAIYQAVVLIDGTPATATLTSCHTSVSYTYSRHGGPRRNTNTTCYGTWTVDGRQHSGEVHGVSSEDYTGETLAVRILDGDAWVATWTVAIVCGVLGLITLAGTVAVVWLSRRSKRRKAAASPPPGPPAGHEHAGHEHSGHEHSGHEHSGQERAASD